jgi:hypothetical protein
MTAMSKNNESKLGRLLSYLVAVTTIIGIPAGLYGYFAGQHKDRVEKTFEFYKVFQSEPVQRDWSLLIGKWNEKAPEAKAIGLKGDAKADLDLIESLMSDQQSSAAFERLLAFFDAAAACVENSLCDQNAAHALLKDPAKQLASAYGPHVLLIRKEFGNPKYGTGLFQTRSIEKSTLNIF